MRPGLLCAPDLDTGSGDSGTRNALGEALEDGGRVASGNRYC